jgi:hypothetical protein
MDASKTLKRLDGVIADSNLRVRDFLDQAGISQSTYYKAKQSNRISRKMNKRFLEIVRSFEPAPAVEHIDMVNSPPHYQREGLECIDAMVHAFGEEAVRTYARLCAFKYQWRADMKGKKDEDLKKAVWYLRWATGQDPRIDG